MRGDVARSALLSAALLAFAGGGAQAQRAMCTIERCDFQADRTLLRRDLWDEPCSLERISRLSASYFDPNGGVRTPLDAALGICLFERIRQQRAPYAAVHDNGLAVEERAIDALQKAQVGVVMPSQRHVLNLFEGLLHCRKLQALTPPRSVDVEGRVALRDRVCFHRAMAKASFAKVEYAGLDVQYVDPNDGSLSLHIDAMSECYQRYLNFDYDAMCAIATAPSRAEIAGLAQRVGGEILSTYFDDAGRTPVGALLTRKVTMAREAMAGSNEAFAQLEAKNAALARGHASLVTRFCTSGDCVPAQVNALVDVYDRAVVTALQLTDVVENFVNGLFRDANNKDVRTTLRESMDVAASSVSRLVQSPNSPHEQNDVLTRLAAMKASLDSLAAQRETAEKATTANLCRLYFCEMYKGLPSRLTAACRAKDLATQGSPPLSATTPRCRLNLADQLLERGVTAASVCREAGFDFNNPTCS